MKNEVQLNQWQADLFEIIKKAAEENKKIHVAMYGLRSGKTFFFNFIEDYFKNNPKQDDVR